MVYFGDWGKNKVNIKFNRQKEIRDIIVDIRENKIIII